MSRFSRDYWCERGERNIWIFSLSTTTLIFLLYLCDYNLGSGLLEFGEFCQLAAKFLVEEDEEGLKKELKEAFRIYDKEGNIYGFISVQ